MAVVTAGGARALEPQRLLAGERVVDVQQLARVGVQEHQRPGLDPNDHGAPAGDLGGEHLPAGERDDAALADRVIDLERGPVFGWRERRRTRRDRAVVGEVGGGQVRAQALHAPG